MKSEWSDPKIPDAKEMVDYLLRTDMPFRGKSQEELLKDGLIFIISSSCNLSIEEVVTLAINSSIRLK